MNSTARIAFEHGVIRLDQQRQDLQNLRNQAAISAAVTGLIATVFATAIGSDGLQFAMQTNRGIALPLLSACALVFFATAVLFATRVVVQWDKFTFSFNSKVMLELGKHELNMDTFFARYASDAERYFQDNEAKIERAQEILRVSMAFGWLQIIPWAVIAIGVNYGK